MASLWSGEAAIPLFSWTTVVGSVTAMELVPEEVMELAVTHGRCSRIMGIKSGAGKISQSAGKGSRST